MIQAALVSCLAAIGSMALMGFGFVALLVGQAIGCLVFMALSVVLFVKRSSDVPPTR